MNVRMLLGATLLLVSPFAYAAALTEIKVDLKLDGSDFVAGERMRGVVDIANSSPDKVRVKSEDPDSDRFLIEIYRAGDHSQMTKVSDIPFVADFYVKTGEGQKLETFLGDHYALNIAARYLAKPVLVHDGTRFEGMPRAFDVVDGVNLGNALQMFTRKPGLQREFELVYWVSRGVEHLYLKAQDRGVRERRWRTYDLGPIQRIDKPTISILANGTVLVLHRFSTSKFARSEFWSLPDALEYRGQTEVPDPETASTDRVRKMYRDSGVKAKQNPWWKFW